LNAQDQRFRFAAILEAHLFFLQAMTTEQLSTQVLSRVMGNVCHFAVIIRVAFFGVAKMKL